MQMRLESHQPEERPQKPLGLAEWQVEEKTERQRGFNGEVGVRPLPAPRADARRLPAGDGLRGHPHTR